MVSVTIEKITELRLQYQSTLAYLAKQGESNTTVLDSIAKMLEIEQKFLMELQSK